MKTYEISSPDGRAWEIDVPDDWTDEQVAQYGETLRNTSEEPLRSTSEEPAGVENSVTQNLAGGSARGVATALGTPVDAINSALGYWGLGSETPVGGAESFRNLFGSLGISTERDPGSISGAVGEVMGEGLPFGIGFAGRAAAPLSALGKEVAALYGGGVGRGVMEQQDADPLSAAVGELLGGASAARLTEGLKFATNTANRLLEPVLHEAMPTVFAKTHERAVAEAMQNAATDPARASANLGGELPLDAPFMSGAASQDPGLLAVERALVRSGDHGTGEMLERERQLQEAIKDKIREQTGREPSAEFVRWVKSDRAYNEAVHDEAIAQAMRRADAAARELPPLREASFVQEQTSRLQREELGKVMKASRADETQLWTDALGGTQLSSAPLKDAVETVNAARLAGDPPIPEDVMTAFNRLDDITTIEDVQSVRSQILQSKRFNNGSQAPDLRINKMLDVLDDATLVALHANAKDPRMLERAIETSRLFNDKFTRGPVGRVLGYDSRGGLRVPEERTLEALLATGLKGRENIRALVRAAGTTDARETVDRYLRARFVSAAVDENGKIIPKNAQKFLEHYRTIFEMEEFAPLGRVLRDAEDASRLVGDLEGQKKLSKQAIEKSRLKLFLEDEDANLQMEKVLQADEPVAALDDLYVKALEDPSGKAMEGLKTLYAETFVDRIIKPTVDALGEETVTEAKLSTLLKRQEKNILKLYGKDGLREMRRALDGLQMMMAPEKARATKIGSDTLENLSRNAFFELMGRIAGVEASAALPKGGAGTIQRPAIMARIGQRLFGQLGAKKRKALLIEAFKDPKKMKYLLDMELTVGNEGAIAEEARAWLIAAGMQDEDLAEAD